MIFFFNLQGHLLEVSNLLGLAQLCWSVLLFPRMTRFHPWVMTHSGIIHGDEFLLNMCMCKHSTHIQAYTVWSAGCTVVVLCYRLSISSPSTIMASMGSMGRYS